MLAFYKPHINFIMNHAVDPDKRRSLVKNEASHHYIDIDHYGKYPFEELPKKWEDALNKYSLDTLLKYGILPWHIQIMLTRLTKAFRDKDPIKILKNSADIGHYIADAHVPLHTNSNHNGQLTNQTGIHAFWESRIPELLAEEKFDFFIGKAEYIKSPAQFIWSRILESAAEADSVLSLERQLSLTFAPDKKYAFEQRKKIVIKQYSATYTKAYDKILNGMVERRMKQSIFCIASFWFTAWVNAGQPNLAALSKINISTADFDKLELLNTGWKKIKVRAHE